MYPTGTNPTRWLDPTGDKHAELIKTVLEQQTSMFPHCGSRCHTDTGKTCMDVWYWDTRSKHSLVGRQKGEGRSWGIKVESFQDGGSFLTLLTWWEQKPDSLKPRPCGLFPPMGPCLRIVWRSRPHQDSWLNSGGPVNHQVFLQTGQC